MGLTKNNRVLDRSSVFTQLIIVLVSLWGITHLQSQEITQKETQKSPSEYLNQEANEKQALNLLVNTPSLGFGNAIADWIYLNFIQYFGDTLPRESIGYDLCPIYFQSLVQKDPRFVNAVTVMDVCTSLFAGYPLRSLEYLQKAVGSMQPKMEAVTIRPYYIWRSIGINQLLFAGEPLKAAESYQKAIEWAKQYQDEDAQRFIANMQNSINYLEKNPDSKMAQIGAWVNVLNTNPDKKTLKRVIKEIKLLGGEVQTTEAGGFNVKLPPETN